MQSKKGVSDVITTVLMIVLVVAAISILGVVILNIVRSNTSNLESQGDCLSNSFAYAIESANYSVPPVSLQVNVQNSGFDNKSAVQIAVFVDGSKKSTLHAPSFGETKPLIISGLTANPTKVEIAPIINGKQCSTSSEKNL